MSVFIIHNGGTYSDRRIYFVEPASPGEFRLVDELLACWGKAWPHGVCRNCGRKRGARDDRQYHHDYETARLLAKVDQAEWFTGRIPVTEFVDEISGQIRDECQDVVAARRVLAICKEVLPPDTYFDSAPDDFRVASPKICVVPR